MLEILIFSIVMGLLMVFLVETGGGNPLGVSMRLTVIFLWPLGLVAASIILFYWATR